MQLILPPLFKEMKQQVKSQERGILIRTISYLLSVIAICFLFIVFVGGIYFMLSGDMDTLSIRGITLEK